MKPPKPDNPTLRFELQLPSECPPLGELVPALLRLLHIIPFFTNPSPGAGACAWVRPGSTYGSICASADFAGIPNTSVVKALVYPDALFPLPLPGDTPPSGAPAGRYAGGTRWQWDDTRRVPGADHSAAGVDNRLCFWVDKGAGFKYDGSTPFVGVTGTSAPCGSGSGSCVPGVRVAGTYPAMWAALVAGFAAGPLGGLNASWLLREDRQAAAPTWDNRGDGKHSARVQLTLDARRGWELTLSLGPHRVAYALPFQGDVFAPLRFPAHQATLGQLGTVTLPAIDVFPAP
jgi:hypothetical protein